MSKENLFNHNDYLLLINHRRSLKKSWPMWYWILAGTIILGTVIVVSAASSSDLNTCLQAGMCSK